MPIKSKVTRSLAALTIAFLTFEEVSCTSPPTPSPTPSPTSTSAQRAELQKTSLQNARTQELEYLKGQEKAVKEEKRNEAWAAQKESALRKSFSTEKGLQNDILKSVECRSSKCDLQFQLSSEEKETVEQRAAIDHWIAANQPCGYTMTTGLNPQQASKEIRIFLNCSVP